ncbi:hypothetical protein LCGC14_1635700 [marine sediment metagenome]|uniref:Uncharacterized protein n=1 Tax=marine sediment metagenome TaxID=412755 RepID=A0A0F9I1J9_9ZZZZ
MANAGSMGILRHIDDPSTTVVAAATATGVTWVSDSTGSGVDFKKAVAAGKGLHYAGNSTATDNEVIEFCGNDLNFAAQEGHCEVEILAQFSTIGAHNFTFGFNDAVEEGAAAMELATDTIVATASAFVGILYDADATNPDLYCVWVNGDTVGQTSAAGSIGGQEIRMRGITPSAAQWLYMKVSLDDLGSGNAARATFLAVDHTGISIEKVFNTTLTRSTPLTYHFVTENRAAAILTTYIKHNNWAQTIPDM